MRRGSVPANPSEHLCLVLLIIGDGQATDLAPADDEKGSGGPEEGVRGGGDGWEAQLGLVDEEAEAALLGGAGVVLGVEGSEVLGNGVWGSARCRGWWR